MSKFLAKFRYSKPAIYEVEILKETEKTITVQEIRPVIGWMYIHSGRMNKEDFDIFDTKSDASEWLIGRANNQISILKEEIKQIEGIIQALGEI